MGGMGLERIKADPCLYYSWTDSGLVTIIPWINNNTLIGMQYARGSEQNQEGINDIFQM